MNEQSGHAHPDLKKLALYAAGDLPLGLRLRVRIHIARCGDCEEELARFRAMMLNLRREAESETLTGFESAGEWRRLEREMIGNIAVGVAAARCIENVGHRRRAASAGVLLVTGLAVLFAIGWFTHIPPEQNEHLLASLGRLMGMGAERPQNVFLQATAKGIAVHTQRATLTMMHPSSAMVTVSGASAVEARYVDEDTGQVTITNVYGQ